MLNVFGAEKLQIQLSEGRMMLLEELVRDYESLLKEKLSKKVITSEETIVFKEAITSKKAITSELKVGEWFRIDREVIDKNKEEICRRCKDAGISGKELWERFEESNKIADENPDQYTRFIETYIFTHDWEYKTEQEMRDMCEKIGDGMCDEVICNFELQMRICNGESVDDLITKADKLPRVRLIKLRNGETGYFGGGADYPPADLKSSTFFPNNIVYDYTPYAFRKVSSQD